MHSVQRRWIYLLVLFLMGLFAHSVGGYAPFFLFVFTLSLYLSAAVMLLLGAQGIAMSDKAEFDERVMVGQDFPLRLTVKNVSLVTWPWLTAAVSAAPGVEVLQQRSDCGVVPPRAKHGLQVQVRFMRRGHYDRFVVRLTLSDLLGLFDQEWAVERKIEMTVLPRLITIDGHLDGSGYAVGVADRDRQRSEDVAQPIGLRSYVHGDSIRRVHWKTTAKTGELMVKTYAHQSRTQVYLYLDCCAGRQAGLGDSSTFERAVVATASLVNHLLTRRIATGLVAAGAPAPFYPASDQLAQQPLLLEALALVDTVANDGTVHRAATELAVVPAGSILVMVSTMASDKLRELLLQLQIRQVKAAVIQLDPESHGGGAFEESISSQPYQDHGFPWVVVTAACDLAKALEEVTHALLS